MSGTQASLSYTTPTTTDSTSQRTQLSPVHQHSWQLYLLTPKSNLSTSTTMESGPPENPWSTTAITTTCTTPESPWWQGLPPASGDTQPGFQSQIRRCQQ